MKAPQKALAALAVCSLLAAASPTPAFWGRDGHLMAGAAAARHLPAEMPEFFLDARDRLSYLNYEPDRWRSDELRQMDDAFQYDHYIDLENVPPEALDEPNRFRFLLALDAAGLDDPIRDGGFLPYRILEVYQRLLSSFQRWRATTDSAQRSWIEERIVNDAGILGHYVTDAAQPHHTSIHFNGWASGEPNPEGYTRSDDIHWRFESAFVSAHVPEAEILRRVEPTPRVFDDVREAVMDHIDESHAQLETLYRLERDVGFDPDTPPHPATVEFAARRLAAGATMLRNLWWTAWVRSEEANGG